ncbi:MAG: HlyD family efflux transporter periplasmic adaptor subunit [Magnetococcales bacterium]|nr:HlyD family efflux transporter periplasmic adaptor subunit [Magnetococcales bacterium]
MDPREQPLPPLREDLSLHAGPPARDGSPTWTLHDPASNRFFRIGWQEFEILSRWSLPNPTRIAAAIGAETTWHPEPTAVVQLLERLQQSHLLMPVSTADHNRLLTAQRSRQESLWRWLLHHYLFLRIPIWNPDRFLRRTLPLVDGLFSGWFVALVLLVALTSLFLIARQWELFTSSLPQFYTPFGLLCYGATLLVSKAVHELGHAYAARRYGCRVPTVGVAWMVMWPVFYTDTSDVWTLSSRRHRLVVGGAGMLAEVALAAFASLAWVFLADGPLRSAAFLLASAVWLLTLAVNLNPLMRFDGYFLLSDYLEIADLQQRAFRLGRWQLREWLFGWGVPPPEAFSRPLRRFLLLFAYAVWCYRLLLFLGIALLVYHQFFKLLGLLLLSLEIGWFLLRPVAQEGMIWFRLRKHLLWNRAMLRSTLLLSLLLIALALPAQYNAPQAAGLLQATEQMVIYAPAAAQLTQLEVASGQQVAPGERLLTLHNPELHYRLDKTAREIVLLRWRLAMQSMETDPMEQEPVLQQDLATALTTEQALRDEEKKLHIHAPFAGQVVDLARDLRPGDWVAKDEPLLTVIGGTQPLVKGYVAAADRERIQVGDRGLFYPDLPQTPPLPGRVVRMDQTPTRVLASPYLASVQGGTIPVRTQKDGKQVVEGSYYRLDLELEQPFPLQQVTRGILRLQTAPVSLLSRWWQLIQAVYQQESGF